MAVQDALLRWRDEADCPASLLVVHGAGGQGKTRLANAFAGECVEAGWGVARAVSGRVSPGDVLPDVESAPEWSGSDLIVVDYAERWPLDTLVQVIRSSLPSVLSAPSGSCSWSVRWPTCVPA
ncbi:ATP-binding protein [Actinokineospora auranticolor]|uniref:ATP-binding protein n=1 Tax=Actinokineospora auranticolor TaxID=155976 RepID=UPI0011B0A8D6|nr:ATP-binding protein [Actinokineospora auranticolor]